MRSVITTLFVIITMAINAQNSDNSLSTQLLYGKKILIIGDSYVKNHRKPIEETWHYKIAQKYSMTYHNYGWNGNCIAFDRTDEGFGHPIYLRYKEMDETADYVIVMAGHNDADNIGRLGTLEDFREKLEVLCEGLIDKYPSAKIAFFTSWRVPRDNFEEVAEITEQVCEKHSIPVFNNLKYSGVYVWNENFRKRYFQDINDTAHLNDEGHNLYMNKAEKFLLTL